jgi:hypothetical protein
MQRKDDPTNKTNPTIPMTEEEKYDHTNKLLEDMSKLLKVYLINMGVDVIPEIKIRPATNWENILSLEELIKCADSTVDPLRYPEGIKTKRRTRYLVIRRQVVCVIARKMKYGCEEIAAALGIDHATTIHAVKMVETLLQAQDKEMTGVYNAITKAIGIHYKETYGKDIPIIKT